MGQSNAQAYEGVSSPPESADELVSNANVLVWNSTSSAWEQGVPDGASGTDDGIGQWAGQWGNTVVTSGDRSQVHIVSHCDGGTIITAFEPGSANWDTFIQKVYASGRDITHMFWWQGEANYSRSHADNLASLNNIRDGLFSALPHLQHIYAFQIAVGACGQDQTTSRSALTSWAAAHSDVSLISLDDPTGDSDFHDGCHYRRAGYFEAGDRLYSLIFP